VRQILASDGAEPWAKHGTDGYVEILPYWASPAGQLEGTRLVSQSLLAGWWKAWSALCITRSAPTHEETAHRPSNASDTEAEDLGGIR
jgi:hypothetical protein